MPITIPNKPESWGWALTNPTQRIKPSLGTQNEGYGTPLQKPTRLVTNWKFWNLGKWTEFLESGGASIMFLATDAPEEVITAIEDIDISEVQSGTWLYTISGVYTFYPTMPTPIVSSEYMIAPTTPLTGDLGAWILTIPSLNTYLSVLQPEIDRIKNKVDEHITDNITEHDIINAKLGNVISVQTAVTTPSSAYTSIANHDSQTKTFTISGLDSSKQYNVDVTPLQGLQDGLNFYAWVSADNTVSVKIINSSNGSLTPTAQSYKFVITE